MKSFTLLAILFVSLLLQVTVSSVSAEDEHQPVISGKIESCSGWSLNNRPELKKFLKLGEAESYQNVQVEYIHGRKAILTIFHDDVAVEKVELNKLDDRQQMHALFVEKGFQLRPEYEIAVLKEERLENWVDDDQVKKDKRKAREERRKQRAAQAKMQGDAADEKEIPLTTRRMKDRRERRKEMQRRQREKIESMSKDERQAYEQERRKERERLLAEQKKTREDSLAEQLEKMSEKERKAYLQAKEEAVEFRKIKEQRQQRKEKQKNEGHEEL